MEGLRTGEQELFNMLRRDMKRTRLLSKDEEKALARKTRAGDIEARNTLIISNLSFIIAMAFRFWRPGKSLMDLVSSGCIGAIIASRRYDPEKEARFLTYAGWWIMRGMQYVDYYADKHPTVSLDDPLFDEEDSTRADLIIDETAFETSMDQVETESLLNYPGLLTDRERVIIDGRFWEDRTLEQIGETLNIGKNRVRQLELKALRKIRNFIEKHGVEWDRVRLSKRTANAEAQCMALLQGK